MNIPKPGPVTDAPYAPQPILPGGVVVTLFPPGSPYLKAEKVREAEVYNMNGAAPGRIAEPYRSVGRRRGSDRPRTAVARGVAQ